MMIKCGESGVINKPFGKHKKRGGNNQKAM